MLDLILPYIDEDSSVSGDKFQIYHRGFLLWVMNLNMKFYLCGDFFHGHAFWCGGAVLHNVDKRWHIAERVSFL